MQVTDEMVRVAHAEYHKVLGASCPSPLPQRRRGKG